MFKSKNKNKNKDNELKFLNYIQPIIEIIVTDIIKSRINRDEKDKDKDNILKHYETSNNKYIDLTQIQNNSKQDSHIFEFNTYIIYKKENISFIAEHWKFKIDTTQSQFNEIKNVHKLRIKKKLLTFFRSIKCMQKLLPLNSLIQKKNIYNLSFQVQLYQQSNLEINPEKTEKKQIYLETIDEKYGSIKLYINYYTMDGITSHEENIKKNFNYFEYYNNYYSQLSIMKTGQSKLLKLQQNNENSKKSIINKEKDINKELVFSELDNDNKIDEKEEIDESNFSRLCEENDLIFSNLIESKILEKQGKLEKNDLEEIKEMKKGNSKEKINLDELYNSCFNNTEDINCRNSFDEILNRNNLMNKENKKLNDIKNKYVEYFGKNELLYEKIKGFEFDDIIINHPKHDMNEKNNFIIDSNYLDEEKRRKSIKISQKEDDLFKEIISDYVSIKKLL
jgi:hypothetical protein